MIVQVGPIPVLVADGVAKWTSGLAIDADGSPKAYALEGSGLHGLDFIGNAGSTGNWYGLACDENGEPYVQTKDDPAPGYCVSCTALFDPNYQQRDPRRYVDSQQVPYVVVPRSLLAAGVKLGDLAVVEYRSVRCGAIVSDVGPSSSLGEGSIALCQALGIDPFRGLPKHRLLGVDGGVSFAVYLGSAGTPAWPRYNVSQLALNWAAQRSA